VVGVSWNTRGSAGLRIKLISSPALEITPTIKQDPCTPSYSYTLSLQTTSSPLFNFSAPSISDFVLYRILSLPVVRISDLTYIYRDGAYFTFDSYYWCFFIKGGCYKANQGCHDRTFQSLSISPSIVPFVCSALLRVPLPSLPLTLIHPLFTNSNLETVGFIYITNHLIPQHEIDAAFQLVLPPPIKLITEQRNIWLSPWGENGLSKVLYIFRRSDLFKGHDNGRVLSDWILWDWTGEFGSGATGRFKGVSSLSYLFYSRIIDYVAFPVAMGLILAIVHGLKMWGFACWFSKLNIQGFKLFDMYLFQFSCFEDLRLILGVWTQAISVGKVIWNICHQQFNKDGTESSISKNFVWPWGKDFWNTLPSQWMYPPTSRKSHIPTLRRLIFPIFLLTISIVNMELWAIPGLLFKREFWRWLRWWDFLSERCGKRYGDGLTIVTWRILHSNASRGRRCPQIFIVYPRKGGK